MRPLLNDVIVAKYDERTNIYHPDTGVKTIDDFVHRVDTLSSGHKAEPDRAIEEDEHYTDPSNAFKGAMFELFVEILIGAFPNDETIGFHDYKPADPTEDYLVVDPLRLSILKIYQ